MRQAKVEVMKTFSVNLSHSGFSSAENILVKERSATEAVIAVMHRRKGLNGFTVEVKELRELEVNED